MYFTLMTTFTSRISYDTEVIGVWSLYQLPYLFPARRCLGLKVAQVESLASNTICLYACNELLYFWIDYDTLLYAN